DVTEWSWAMPTGSDEEHSETELADGRTVTTDVSDVDTVPTDEAEANESTESESESEGERKGRTDDTDASDPDTEQESDDGQQSGGLSSRLKHSESSAVSGSDDSADAEQESDEQPALSDLHGTVIARMAANLRSDGFETVEEVYEADNTALAEVEGIDVSKAAFFRRQAAKTLDRPQSVVESPADSEESDSAQSPSESVEDEDEPESEDEAEAEDESETETDADPDTDADAST